MTSEGEARTAQKRGWGWRTGLALLALLLVLDLLAPRHGEFDWEVGGFFAAWGFVSCGVLVLLARVLRRVLTRPEDYYDR